MRYTNRFDSSKEFSFLDILKWQLLKKKTITREISSLELVDNSGLLDTKDDFICWLGHASFLIQLDKIRVLFDPIFENIPFYKRYSPTPYSLELLGDIDYVFISHTHYDHFDIKTIKRVLYKKPIFIVPLGLDKYLYKIDKNIKCIKLDWYNSFNLSDEVELFLVPAKHWCKRGLFDINRALWGGAILSSKNSTIYFAGDTAYDIHFKEIGSRYSIDYALLPIGAYNPSNIMKYNHLNPKEALRAYIDLDADIFIPMHYGTFKLSDEPLNEPSEWIDRLIKDYKDKIYKIKIGEVKLC